MELRHSVLSGGRNKLSIRKLHKPPHVEKQQNSIPVRKSQHISHVNQNNHLIIMKKVTIISTSLRPGSNSHALAEQFAKGAEADEQQISFCEMAILPRIWR